jgi:TusA-related sulfurtransferase
MPRFDKRSAISATVLKPVAEESPVHVVDAEELVLGGGLEVLLEAALQRVAPGEILEVTTPAKAVSLEMPGWASNGGHEVVGEGSGRGVFRILIRRGTARRILAVDAPERRPPLDLRANGEFHTADWRPSGPPPRPDEFSGLLPLDALPEAGAPARRWALSDPDALWADDVGELVEQASAHQWDASRDVPWEAARSLGETTERAVSQVMTYLAQNEYAALYVPAGFLPHINPQLPEIVLWLGSHVHDEARHLEVFTKRSLIGGYRSYALASTELSLQTLLDVHDFSAASLLLNVLGEGTFLDLLSFIERHAPDAATATSARLAHRDEQRHVHFGISHIRGAVGRDPDLRVSLVAAAEERASKLTSLSGLSPILVEALTLMATPSMQPAELSETAAAVSRLMTTMERNRLRRLAAAGFDAATARHLSDLHTPNLM